MISSAPAQGVAERWSGPVARPTPAWCAFVNSRPLDLVTSLLNLTVPFLGRKYRVRSKLACCLPALVSLSLGVSSCGDGSVRGWQLEHDPRPYFAGGDMQFVSSEVAPDSVSYSLNGQVYLLLKGPPVDLDPDRIVKIDVLRDSTALRAIAQRIGESLPRGAVFLLLADSITFDNGDGRLSSDKASEGG